jgi:hypothetical protein
VWDIERRTGELRDARGDALAGAFARHAECLGNGPLLTRSIPMATWASPPGKEVPRF